jgi:hypothetical protein
VSYDATAPHSPLALFLLHTRSVAAASMARSALALLALVSLASFVSASTPEGVAYLKAKALEEGVVTLPSGLMYKVRVRSRKRAHAVARSGWARVNPSRSSFPGSDLARAACCQHAAVACLRALQARRCHVCCWLCRALLRGTHALRPIPTARAQPPLPALLPSSYDAPHFAASQVLHAATPGGKRPLVSTPCECHYAGSLIDGTEFDSSIKRGAPTTFAPNQGACVRARVRA